MGDFTYTETSEEVFEEYIVLFGDAHEVSREVSRKLSKGWKPFGGVSLSCSDHSWRAAQAMVLPKKGTNGSIGGGH